MTLSRLAQTIVSARGWWRILIAFLAGAASTLALPPTNVWPVPFVTFSILVQGLTMRRVLVHYGVGEDR